MQTKYLRRHVTEYYNDTGEVIVDKDYPLTDEGLIFLSRNKIFSKRFMTKEPKFSNRAYLGHWYILTGYLEQNTNKLVERKYTDNHWLVHIPISPNRMQEILGVSSTTHYRFIKECASKGYIAETTNNVTDKTEYYMSPIYALNGVGISVELYLHFRGVDEIENALTLLDKSKIRKYLGVDLNNEAEDKEEANELEEE